MAKFDLKFLDLNEDLNDYIKVNYTDENTIFISGEYDNYDFLIELDKSTAIKFAKTLRTEINKIKDEDNG